MEASTALFATLLLIFVAVATDWTTVSDRPWCMKSLGTIR